jgi:glycosyltransferase involved in cell wall biosynthesis
MANARAFILAAFEDFGITPVEAMAAGTPVIAYQAGGALDYVVPGETGEFFAEQSPVSLAATLELFHNKSFDSRTVQLKAAEFSVKTFQDRIKKFVDKIGV